MLFYLPKKIKHHSQKYSVISDSTLNIVKTSYLYTVHSKYTNEPPYIEDGKSNVLQVLLRNDPDLDLRDPHLFEPLELDFLLRMFPRK